MVEQIYLLLQKIESDRDESDHTAICLPSAVLGEADLQVSQRLLELPAFVSPTRTHRRRRDIDQGPAPLPAITLPANKKV